MSDDNAVMIDVSEIEEIALIGIRPGDTLVLRCPQIMSEEAHRNIRESLMRHHGLKAIVLENGIELDAVLCKEEK